MSEQIQFSCPQCATANRIDQVQGDRCPACGFEFKWFRPGEERTAQDYLQILTGRKHYLALPEDLGYIVAHE
jgi:hypothetical protein